MVQHIASEHQFLHICHMVMYRFQNEKKMTRNIHVYMCITKCVDNYFNLLCLFQMCYLVVHSTMQHQMRILTVREQYVLLNHSPIDMLLRAYALPLSKEKV